MNTTNVRYAIRVNLNHGGMLRLLRVKKYARSIGVLHNSIYPEDLSVYVWSVVLGVEEYIRCVENLLKVVIGFISFWYIHG